MKKTWLSLSLATLFSASAFAESSQDIFAATFNRLNTENISDLSKQMNDAADLLATKGEPERASILRTAALPASLAMARAYTRERLKTSDVNGIYLFMAGEHFCEKDRWYLPNNAFDNTTYCIGDLIKAILTLGEKNSTPKQTL